MMRLPVCVLMIVCLCGCRTRFTAEPAGITNMHQQETMWKKEFDQLLPKLGHRNWILVVDKAFPLQSAPGIITINTGQPLRPVLAELTRTLAAAPHIKPIIYTDLELSYLSDELCPGAEATQDDITEVLKSIPIQTITHEEIFSKVDSASKLFTTVVLKTESLIPYSSIFIELDCGYWTAEAEKALRVKMKSKSKSKK